MALRRFVLLDRDGTVIVERNYLADADGVELLPGAARGLGHLQMLGLGLVLVTNQSGIGRGFFSRRCVDDIHARLGTLLARDGIRLDGIYVCPHAPEEACVCRKPAPGLAERAAADLNFDLATCFVIGDKPCDMDLGRNIGAVTLLTRTGYGAQFAHAGITADHTVGDLAEAAAVIAGLI